MVDEQPDFFVSYTEADQLWAEWISLVLEKAGYRVVVQAWDFGPGSFMAQMEHAIQSSRILLPVLSEAYLESRYGRMEWNAFVQEDLSTIIPVQIEDIDKRSILRHNVHVHLRGLNERDATDHLLSKIESLVGAPRHAPQSRRHARFPGEKPSSTQSSDAKRPATASGNRTRPGLNTSSTVQRPHRPLDGKATWIPRRWHQVLIALLAALAITGGSLVARAMSADSEPLKSLVAPSVSASATSVASAPPATSPPSTQDELISPQTAAPFHPPSQTMPAPQQAPPPPPSHELSSADPGTVPDPIQSQPAEAPAPPITAGTCYDSAKQLTYQYSTAAVEFGAFTTTSLCKDINMKLATNEPGVYLKACVVFVDHTDQCNHNNTYTTVGPDWTTVATDVKDNTRFILRASAYNTDAQVVHFLLSF